MTDDNEEYQRLLTAREMSDHLRTFMPEEQAAVAMIDASLIMLSCIAIGTPIKGLLAKSSAFAMGGYTLAMMLRKRANGRKLTNEKKRREITAVAALLRDSADQLEAVVLAEGKAKQDG